jgi:hypothetical protein
MKELNPISLVDFEKGFKIMLKTYKFLFIACRFSAFLTALIIQKAEIKKGIFGVVSKYYELRKIECNGTEYLRQQVRWGWNG